MGRAKIQLDMDLLRQLDRPAPTQTERFRLLSEAYHKRTGQYVQPQLIRLRMKDDFPELKKYVPKKYHYLIGNSPKDLLHLKCLDCAGFSEEEIKLCQIKTCAIYHVRPYT